MREAGQPAFRVRGFEKTNIVRVIPVIVLILLFASPLAVQAQIVSPGDGTSITARLSADKLADIQDGNYSAGDRIAFSLENFGDRVLLRFDGSPEIFALLSDRVALGGRALKYDTGATALHESVWGGLTIYTETAPGGLPATRTGDFAVPPRLSVSRADLETALRDEAAHLAYTQQVNLRFTATMGNDAARAEAFNALSNVDAGIARITANPAGRTAVAKRIQTVKLTEARKPEVSVAGRVLTVTFAPAQGPTGRPSSRAIAAALGKYLSVSDGD